MKDMSTITNATIAQALVPEVRKNARAVKTLRNARARKLLEVLREEKELKQWLSDVWSEPDDEALTAHHDRREEIIHSSLAA